MTALRSCVLSDVADVGLGFKSLQNDFFYLDPVVIEHFGIEADFLRPLYMLADFRDPSYLQDRAPTLQVFHCELPTRDLGGTGALRYIRQMADKPAKRKKQSGKALTIREALSAQGGGLWYGPKAILHAEHVWLRKAFGSVFAPFIIRDAQAVDQRFNYVRPLSGIDWQVIAAITTSSVFALSLESSGGASMGAGALEVATRPLARVRVPDVRLLESGARTDLVELANAVWADEAPVDWANERPGPALEELDRFVIGALERELPVQRLYEDLGETVAFRLRVASDRRKREKRSIAEDVASVASGIANAVRPILEMRRFPEDFVELNGALRFVLGDAPVSISAEQMLGTTHLTIRQVANERVLLDQAFDRAIAEVIVRATLLGRREFVAPNDEAQARHCLDQFWPWYRRIQGQVEELCSESALGTRFEQDVAKAVFDELGIRPEAGADEVPRQVILR